MIQIFIYLRNKPSEINSIAYYKVKDEKKRGKQSEHLQTLGILSMIFKSISSFEIRKKIKKAL